MLLLSSAMTSCTAPARPAGTDGLQVLAVESFLMDIARNVAGDRFEVETLIPMGVDPHAFELTPQDVARIAEADILIMNGAGLETWLLDIIENNTADTLVIQAADGLDFAADRPGDPHFWLNPLNAKVYVDNIRDGFSGIDPAGKPVYAAKADAYKQQLDALDGWIKGQVAGIPVDNRLLVTNHESLGYFADRYGFKVIGNILDSHSSSAAPSAEHLAELVTIIQESGAKAVFLESGANAELAETLSNETGIRVVLNLETHSVTPAGGHAPSYIDLLRWNTRLIVEALQ